MEALIQRRMTADEFITWSMQQPEDRRYELMDGDIYQMASERYLHALAKGAVHYRLRQAVVEAGLPCTVFTDGMAVRINASTVYEPDAALRRGAPLGADQTHYDDPIIVVEVASPSTQSLDGSAKLSDYFTLPSLQHYLIIHPVRRTVIHHARQQDGTVLTRFASTGAIELQPPGIQLQADQLFE